MKQADLHRAVARATGETVDRIARMGFNLVVVPDRPPVRTWRSSQRRRRPFHKRAS